jgi:hypothetical protein
MADHPSMCPMCTKPYTLDRSGASAVPKVRAASLERPNLAFVGENRLPLRIPRSPRSPRRQRAGGERGDPLRLISIFAQFTMDQHLFCLGGNMWLIVCELAGLCFHVVGDAAARVPSPRVRRLRSRG